MGPRVGRCDNVPPTEDKKVRRRPRMSPALWVCRQVSKVSGLHYIPNRTSWEQSCSAQMGTFLTCNNPLEAATQLAAQNKEPRQLVGHVFYVHAHLNQINGCWFMISHRFQVSLFGSQTQLTCPSFRCLHVALQKQQKNVV